LQADGMGIGSNQAMEKEAIAAPRQQDFSGLKILGLGGKERGICRIIERTRNAHGTTRDFDHVARPQRGQHALAIDAETQTTALAESLRRQSAALAARIRARRTHDICEHQDVFCWN
jgi:hypothetical protein